MLINSENVFKTFICFDCINGFNRFYRFWDFGYLLKIQLIEILIEIFWSVPKLAQVFSNKSLSENSYFQFFCSAEKGSDPLFFEWSRNGHKIKASPDVNYKIENFKRHSIFTIERLSKSDSASYGCVVSNEYGSDSQNILLTVKGIVQFNKLSFKKSKFSTKIGKNNLKFNLAQWCISLNVWVLTVLPMIFRHWITFWFVFNMCRLWFTNIWIFIKTYPKSAIISIIFRYICLSYVQNVS